jgi:hypothetical protein
MNTIDLCTCVIVLLPTCFLVILRSLLPPFLCLGRIVLIHFLGQQLGRVLGTLIQYCYLLLTCVPHIYIYIYIVSLPKAPPFSQAEQVLLCNQTNALRVVTPAFATCSAGKKLIRAG